MIIAFEQDRVIDPLKVYIIQVVVNSLYESIINKEIYLGILLIKL